jgi:ketosteroid isomerase-like protein
MTSSTGRTGTTTGNAATVAGIYDAFGRGDVPAILARLAEDVAWEDWWNNWAQRAGVPAMARRSGPAEVADFFAIVGTWTPHEFAVLDVIGDGRQVVAGSTLSLRRVGRTRSSHGEEDGVLPQPRTCP